MDYFDNHSSTAAAEAALALDIQLCLGGHQGLHCIQQHFAAIRSTRTGGANFASWNRHGMTTRQETSEKKKKKEKALHGHW
jgi:hypothetical protein